MSSTDLVLTTMANSSINIWGFLLVRCTYDDESKWDAFLADIKDRTHNIPHDRGHEESVTSGNQLNESLRWTIIEDREKLDGASTQIASVTFGEWVQTAGREELKQDGSNPEALIAFPRYTMHIYVTASALEIVTEGPRFQETGPGHQPTLVRLDLSLKPPQSFEGWDDDVEEGDKDEFENTSCFRINASNLVDLFASNLELNDWYFGWEDAQLRAAENSSKED